MYFRGTSSVSPTCVTLQLSSKRQETGCNYPSDVITLAWQETGKQKVLSTNDTINVDNDDNK